MQARYFLGLLLGVVSAGYGLSLSSDAFQPNQPIPTLYTCEGKDLSPALAWGHAPVGTKTYTLTMYDPDAPSGPWVHWQVFNLPVSATGLEEGAATLPIGTTVGKNSWGHVAYNGPCPPMGTHHYVFTLYALSDNFVPSKGIGWASLLQALAPITLEKAELTGIYTKR